MSGRVCSYASQSEGPGISDVFSHSSTRHPDNTWSQDSVTVPDLTTLTAAPLSCVDDQDATFEEAINFNHMELIIHLTTNKEMFNLGDIDSSPSSFSLALQTGLESPYLLYQLLAFSARHLAFLHPNRFESYLHQAISLQTRAVSLFNASEIKLSQSSSVSILLFSTILGHHLLADTLAKRDSHELEAFIAHYTQCVEMHRGIYTIATTAWPLLMESELKRILQRSSEFTSRAPRGNHCQRIRELVENTDGLREEDKAACRLAIRYLQIGFDAVLAAGEEQEPDIQYQMLFLWTVLVPREFTSLLAAFLPEPLVVLAYYALLLHYGKNMWQVGDAGVYILHMILEYLGPEWGYWLEYPSEKIGKDLK